MELDRRFNPLAADGRWQQAWDDAQAFRADDSSPKPCSRAIGG